MTAAPPARALVIMAKAARVGHVKTRLASVLSADAVVALYRCLIEDTVALVRTLPATRVAVVCPAGEVSALAAWLEVEVVAQDGNGLAAGLASAFRTFLGGGCGRVVAFNGDSPHLPRSTLERAFELLDTHDLVVGPTVDGGYYLVGATAPHPDLFDGGRMGTGTALDSLLERAHDLGLSVASTDPWYDVDEAQDLRRLADELRIAPALAPRTAAWLATWDDERAGHE